MEARRHSRPQLTQKSKKKLLKSNFFHEYAFELLCGCLLAFQVIEISLDFWKFRVILETRYETPTITEIPNVSICCPLKSLVDLKTIMERNFDLIVESLPAVNAFAVFL